MGKFQDPRGGHVRIYWQIIESPAWKALSFSQQALYVALRRRLTSNSNGNIEASAAGLRKQGFDISSSALAAGLQALITVGLIAVTRPGGWVGRGQAIATLYRFTDDPSHEWRALQIPAYKVTNNWQRFTTMSDATSAIAAAGADSKARHEQRQRERETKKQVATQSDPIEKIRRLEKPHRLDSKNRSGSTRKTKSEAISGFEIRGGGRSADLAASLIH